MKCLIMTYNLLKYWLKRNEIIIYLEFQWFWLEFKIEAKCEPNLQKCVKRFVHRVMRCDAIYNTIKSRVRHEWCRPPRSPAPLLCKPLRCDLSAITNQSYEQNSLKSDASIKTYPVPKLDAIKLVCFFEQFRPKSGCNELGVFAQLMDHVCTALK